MRDRAKVTINYYAYDLSEKMEIIDLGWPWRSLITSTVGYPSDSWASWCTRWVSKPWFRKLPQWRYKLTHQKYRQLTASLLELRYHCSDVHRPYARWLHRQHQLPVQHGTLRQGSVDLAPRWLSTDSPLRPGSHRASWDFAGIPDVPGKNRRQTEASQPDRLNMICLQGVPKKRIPSFIFGITLVIQHRF